MIYGYLRVSTDNQGVKAQRVGIKAFCKEKGWRIDKFISDEGISGITEYNERQLGKLLSRCKEGDILICSELSRIGRSLLMIMRFLELCMKKGIKLYTIKDGYELGDNIQSKVLAFAFGLAAELERELMVRRSIEGQKAFLARGGKMGAVAKDGRRGLKLDKFDAEVRRYAAEGKPKAFIARSFGVTSECVSRYLELNDIPYTPKRNVCNNERNHKATIKTLQECRGAIEYGVKNGWTFQHIYEHVKQCFRVKISEKSVRFYIRKDPVLNDIWVAVNDKRRLEANIKATVHATKKSQYKRELIKVNNFLSNAL